MDSPDVDAVYVASPHSHHRDHALLALRAGKHVLVEKAFTRNAAEARELVAAAADAGVLLMEAMWTRYLPHMDVVRRILEDGLLGQVHRITADYGVRAEPDPTHRLLDPALAGGVLLDLGIYPLSFASAVAGAAGIPVRPTSVQAAGSLAPTGVDAQVSAQIGYGTAQAQLFTSMLTASGHTAQVYGSLGRIEVDDRCYVPAGVTLTVGERSGTWDANRVHGYGGLSFQAAALATYVAEGRTDSPLLPLRRDGDDPRDGRRDPPPGRRRLPGRGLSLHARPRCVRQLPAWADTAARSMLARRRSSSRPSATEPGSPGYATVRRRRSMGSHRVVRRARTTNGASTIRPATSVITISIPRASTSTNLTTSGSNDTDHRFSASRCRPLSRAQSPSSESAGHRLSGERSPTNQRWPNGSTKPPCRCVPHGAAWSRSG